MELVSPASNHTPSMLSGSGGGPYDPADAMIPTVLRIHPLLFPSSPSNGKHQSNWLVSDMMGEGPGPTFFEVQVHPRVLDADEMLALYADLCTRWNAT